MGNIHCSCGQDSNEDNLLEVNNFENSSKIINNNAFTNYSLNNDINLDNFSTVKTIKEEIKGIKSNNLKHTNKTTYKITSKTDRNNKEDNYYFKHSSNIKNIFKAIKENINDNKNVDIKTNYSSETKSNKANLISIKNIIANKSLDTKTKKNNGYISKIVNSRNNTIKNNDDITRRSYTKSKTKSRKLSFILENPNDEEDNSISNLKNNYYSNNYNYKSFKQTSKRFMNYYNTHDNYSNNTSNILKTGFVHNNNIAFLSRNKKIGVTPKLVKIKNSDFNISIKDSFSSSYEKEINDCNAGMLNNDSFLNKNLIDINYENENNPIMSNFTNYSKSNNDIDNAKVNYSFSNDGEINSNIESINNKEMNVNINNKDFGKTESAKIIINTSIDKKNENHNECSIKVINNKTNDINNNMVFTDTISDSLNFKTDYLNNHLIDEININILNNSINLTTIENNNINNKTENKDTIELDSYINTKNNTIKQTLETNKNDSILCSNKSKERKIRKDTEAAILISSYKEYLKHLIEVSKYSLSLNNNANKHLLISDNPRNLFCKQKQFYINNKIIKTRYKENTLLYLNSFYPEISSKVFVKFNQILHNISIYTNIANSNIKNQYTSYKNIANDDKKTIIGKLSSVILFSSEINEYSYSSIEIDKSSENKFKRKNNKNFITKHNYKQKYLGVTSTSLLLFDSEEAMILKYQPNKTINFSEILLSEIINIETIHSKKELGKINANINNDLHLVTVMDIKKKYTNSESTNKTNQKSFFNKTSAFLTSVSSDLLLKNIIFDGESSLITDCTNKKYSLVNNKENSKLDQDKSDVKSYFNEFSHIYKCKSAFNSIIVWLIIDYFTSISENK